MLARLDEAQRELGELAGLRRGRLRPARWELDLALVYDHEALPEPAVRLERTHLLDDPFDLVVPDGHPLARRASVLGVLEETADGFRSAVGAVAAQSSKQRRSRSSPSPMRAVGMAP